ncbi:PxKF domain-containing protein [Lysobacter korlensis]|uniref:PxKF domain-containing protein n=1 Tax=Lysobacter korlensis TaxID=553636 RepID=A0ABV6RXZ5_9GAMM
MRKRLRKVRRAGFVLALVTIAVAPLTLLPPAAVAEVEAESPWPFSLVPRAAWRGTAPTRQEAGNVVPVEFRVGGYRGLGVLTPHAPISIAVDCESQSPRTVASPPSAPSKGVLTYDWLTDTYTFWWPRAEVWIGTCRQLHLELDDGTVHPVMVYFGESDNVIVP